MSEVKELTEAIRALDLTVKQLLAAGIVTAANVPQKKPNKEVIPDEFKPKPSPEETDDDVREKVIVYIRVVFLKVGEIDTLKEKYMADVFIQARWREPSLDGQTDIDHDTINWDDYWLPELYVENVLGEAKESVWHVLTHDATGAATIYEKRRVTGYFLEFLELNEFPFDTQDLTITVTTEKSQVEVSLEEDANEICGINVQSFVDEQEWRLHGHIETWKKVTTKVYQNAKFKHPALAAACKASRRPGFFIWNVFFVMLFICSLAFTTFSVDIKLPQNRLQLSFILLLTTVTFKFIVNQSLPRISYLTYLDKYILSLMTILCSICVWHSIVTLISNRDAAILADDIALGVLGALFLGFHLFFVLQIVCVARRKSFKIFRKDKEHQERMRVLDKVDDVQANAGATETSGLNLKSNGNQVEPNMELEDV